MRRWQRRSSRLATEPGIVSFAGGAFVAVWPAQGDPVVVDGNVAMPGVGGDPNRWGQGLRPVDTDYGGGVRLYAGDGSVATPGAVPALERAHAAWGRLPWQRLLAPAVEAARQGYPMSPAAARYLRYTSESLFGHDPETHAIVTADGGVPLAGGQVTRNTALADTLDDLGHEGGALFRTGWVGRELVAQMASGQGLVTTHDLADYDAVVREAQVIEAADWQIALNPPPAIGGVTLAVMMAELVRANAATGAWTWRDAIEIQQAVLGHRLDVLDLSRDLDVAGAHLMATVRERGLSALGGSSATAHVSAVDRRGNACAITMSSGYGSGTCIPGTGILLNNALGEVELNRTGLHALPAGTRLASNMAPTTARTRDGRVLAIGSPGADRITSALMLVLGQGCLHGAALQDAIDAPRLHLRRRDSGWVVEHELDDGIAAAVASLGLSCDVYPEPHMYFGGVGAAYRGPDERLTAAGDARREAEVGVR